MAESIWVEIAKAVVTGVCTAAGLTTAAWIAFNRQERHKARGERLTVQRDALLEYTRTLATVWRANTPEERREMRVAVRVTSTRIMLAFGSEPLADDVRSFLELCIHWKDDGEQIAFHGDDIDDAERTMNARLCAAMREAERALGVKHVELSAQSLLDATLVRRPPKELARK